MKNAVSQDSLVSIVNSSNVFLEGTSVTPEVILSEDEGSIKISGRSLPEDAKSFYDGIKDWLSRYAESPLEGTHVEFIFEYFNTASSKMILELLDVLKKTESKDKKLTVDWHYNENDEDMLEAGEEFADISGLKFNYIGY